MEDRATLRAVTRGGHHDLSAFACGWEALHRLSCIDIDMIRCRRERPPLPLNGTERLCPEAFLAKVGTDLKAAKQADSDVAAILAEYLLAATASDNAVNLAKDALVRLAEERASYPEVADGVADIR